ncbi:DUF2306 domain-containing protein [Promicromonospora iranensis]|uniref:Membrane protein DUF2306 n=1 Tax=Promicromonospora iranensis TaxID=1105144 RepID=A0ABU2CH69_9MICO|nr:DUF2306 domain-containing protein [Promicromonospora iranensis]MDR7380659.1 hypothetical protein [Promicromonospora iranensis]
MTTPQVMTRSTSRREWLVPAGLLLLALVPALGGAVRVSELAADPALTTENARFVTQPIPVLVHIVCVTVYSLLGAFQFVPSLRRRSWHRLAGRVLFPAGLGTALTGLWMTAFYDMPAKDTAVVNGVRYVVGVVMVVALVLGVRAALRRDFVTHRAWMVRAYALAMGAGTQALLLGPFIVVAGIPGPVTNTVLMTAAWVINAAFAEWVIRRRRVARRTTGRAAGRVAGPV